MRGSWLAVLLVTLGVLATPRFAWAAPPGELSQQGTRRGGVEIGLGVLLTGTAGGLIAFGTVQMLRAQDHVEFCNQSVTVIDDNQSGGGIDPCLFDPPPLGFASAGLSWGFSIPLLVGGAMLFARAHRIRVDARTFERTRTSSSVLRRIGWRSSGLRRIGFAPWWGPGRGGATLMLRF